MFAATNLFCCIASNEPFVILISLEIWYIVIVIYYHFFEIKIPRENKENLFLICLLLRYFVNYNLIFPCFDGIS